MDGGFDRKGAKPNHSLPVERIFNQGRAASPLTAAISAA
jgi:hypothetical protein